MASEDSANLPVVRFHMPAHEMAPVIAVDDVVGDGPFRAKGRLEMPSHPNRTSRTPHALRLKPDHFIEAGQLDAGVPGGVGSAKRRLAEFFGQNRTIRNRPRSSRGK